MKNSNPTLHWTQALIDHLLLWSRLGIVTTSDGSRLVGQVPHIAKAAYFHILPAPVSPPDLVKLSRKLGMSSLGEFGEFMLHLNGASLFSGTLDVYGIRRNYQRANLLEASAQPFDADIPNLDERPKGLKHSQIIIGGYAVDGSQVIQEHDGSILRTVRFEPHSILNRWNSLEDWLMSETLRLEKLFDSSGICLFPHARLPAIQKNS